MIERILLHPPGERLMCPDCLITSNNHIPIMETAHYHVFSNGEKSNTLVVNHVCKVCGYVDTDGHGFCDSGNYECDETKGLYEMEKEISNLEDELADLRHKLEAGKARWDYLWSTKEDRDF